MRVHNALDDVALALARGGSFVSARRVRRRRGGRGHARGGGAHGGGAAQRGLHSFTSQLNLSVFYGMGGARRGCVARIKGVFMVCRVLFLWQSRLKLS